MSRRRAPELPAPYLRRILLEPDRVANWSEYPFSLPLFAARDFELPFERPITIIVGENGSGKSTLLEGIAALAGFDEAGGGNGYRPVDHSRALDESGAGLAAALRAHWLPKITRGWFFRAESFFSVARYLDISALDDPSAVPPDFLSHSHGEGFLRFFGSASGSAVSSFSTSRSPRFRPPGRSASSNCSGEWNATSPARSSWRRIRPC